jgi:2,3-bisphosphoglycerate-independent phosphoglycerate mutase
MSAALSLPVVDLASSLAVPADTTILLVVIDGLGGIPRENKTELETAWIPNLDRLAARSSLGLCMPIELGITPGSGPAHLALFGYDPIEYQVGRGVLEALGVGLEVKPGDVCARANFATVDADGKVTDRRAGRINSDVAVDLCKRLQSGIPSVEDVEVIVRPGREHRFVVVFRGPGLRDGVTDSDPLAVGSAPLAVDSLRTGTEKTARIANAFLERATTLLVDQPRANAVLLRGLAERPNLPVMTERFKIRPACVAPYPMYRGIARLVGMEVLDVGDDWLEEIEVVRRNKDRFDYFYVHFKETDKAGEDGDFDAKVELIERFDEEIMPQITGLGFDVVCITGDHSTPAVMSKHSWHSVPFLINSHYVRPQVRIEEFGERACTRGNLGYLKARQAMTLMLAHAQRLRKFGA